MSEENNSQKQENQENVARDNSLKPKSLVQMSSFRVLFEKSWSLFSHGIKKFISLLLIPLLAYALVFAFVFIASLFVLKRDLGISSIIFVLLIIALIISAIILAIIAKTGIYLYIKDFQKKPLLIDILKMAKKRAFGFFIVGFFVGLFIMLWSLLFIIPGIIFALYYSLSYWAYIYENKTGVSALKRSKDLIKGYWWAVFELYFLLYGSFFLFFFGTTWIVDLLFNNSIIEMAWGIIIQIASFLIAPLFIVFSCFIYWDLRRIKG
jgi:hypothetical protein